MRCIWAVYIIGQSVAEVSADFASCAPGRLLEDDAALQIRFSDGTIGRLWTSAIAVGQMHGLTIRIFGEKGGLRWRQEEPNQIIWSPLDEPSRTLERGASGLHPIAARGSRIPVGHPEGMLEAFANIYSDLHAAISRRPCGRANRRGRGLSGVPCGSGNGQGRAGRHDLVEESRTVDPGLIKSF